MAVLAAWFGAAIGASLLGLAGYDLRIDLHFNFRAQTDVQFTQLLVVNIAWCVGEEALGALCFREGDHIADRLGGRGRRPVRRGVVRRT